MADIVVSEFMDEAAIATLRIKHDVDYAADFVDRPEALSEALADARALIVRNRTQVTADLIAAAPRLACVGRLGVGLDNIDLDACRAGDIAVFPATGANDASVAEYVVTAALMLMRTAFRASDKVAVGAWPRTALIGREVSGKTLGLIGFGNTAQHTARLARGVGMTTIAFDPYRAADDPAWSETEAVSLDQLLRRADVVTLHVPLTDETRHLIGAAALAAMKDDAILVNASRGGVVDEAALADALRAGTLAGAALDVFETEPLTAEAGARFDDVPNLILTPHIAGVTEEANVRVGAVTAQSVLRHLEGLP